MTDDKTAAEPASPAPQASAPSSDSPAARPAASAEAAAQPASDAPAPPAASDASAKPDADATPTAEPPPRPAAKPEPVPAAAKSTLKPAPQKSAAASSASAAPRRGSAWPWILLLVVLASAIAAAAWYGTRTLQAEFAARDAQLGELTQQLAAVRAQAEQTQQRVSDQVPQLQRNAAGMQRLGERLDAQDAAVGAIREELSGGRLRVQLAIVEQLLVLAADRLQVARDVPAALTALQAADDHLAAMKDPRLFAVRQAIAEERTALRAVALPDETGMALTLASLSARAPQLPFIARLPDHFEATPATAGAAPSEGDSRWQRLWQSVRSVLASMFTIRRDAGPSPTLLSVEQEALIVQVLTLKLEGARLTLLRGDSAGFREYCESAVTWLDDYFRGEDAGVQAARAELMRLHQIQLTPPLPDVGRSLQLLRQHLESDPQ